MKGGLGEKEDIDVILVCETLHASHVDWELGCLNVKPKYVEMESGSGC